MLGEASQSMGEFTIFTRLRKLNENNWNGTIMLLMLGLKVGDKITIKTNNLFVNQDAKLDKMNFQKSYSFLCIYHLEYILQH